MTRITFLQTFILNMTLFTDRYSSRFSNFTG